MNGERRLRRSGGLILAIGFILVAWFYVWTACPSLPALRIGKPQFDYYSLLLHGFQKGHLYMDTPVSEELRSLANPYDPAARAPGTWLGDASYYQGHYYLYFGATPLVTLMLPFRLIAGFDLPAPLAMCVFASMGFLASLILWKSIRDRYFPEVSAWVDAGAVLLLGVVDLMPALLRRPTFYEMPIAAGYCFLMAALLALYLSLHAVRWRLAWLAVASLSLGLTVGARPIFVVAAPILLIPIFWRWRSGVRALMPDIAAAAIPLGVVGVLLGAYNVLRFGRWTEFGHHYQLNHLYYDATMRQFAFGYAPFNLFAYTLALPEFSRHYPFFLFPGGLSPIPVPAGYGEVGMVAGLLVCFPICWLAVLSPFGGRASAVSGRSPFGAWLLCAWWVFASAAGLLIFYFAAIIRYMPDFTPALMLCAAVGLLVFERWLRTVGGIVRVLGRVLWIGALAMSSGVAVLLSLELYGLLRERNPEAHVNIAEAFDRLSFWNPRLSGATNGPVETVLRLLRIEPGLTEPVLSSGSGDDAETVSLRGLEDGGLEVVYARGREPPRFSIPLPLHAGEIHRLTVDLGSFHPPQAADSKSANGRNRLEILLDGEPVIEGGYDGSVPVSTYAFAGFDPNADRYLRTPMADIISARRPAAGEVVRAMDSSAVSLQFRPPQDRTTGSAPLLSVGGPSGDVCVAIDYLGRDKADLRLTAGGRDLARSVPLPVSDDSWHQLVLMQHPNLPGRPLSVLADGATVLTAPVGDFDLFHSGQRPGWEPASGGRFTGFIRNVSSSSLVPTRAAPPGSRISLVLRLPKGRKGEIEPLLVTGSAGSGDLYEIVYVDEDHVRLEFDHWGAYVVYMLSPPIEADYGAAHRIDFWLPGFGTGEMPDKRELHGYTSVDIDGRSVWSQDLPYYRFSTDEIYLGRNAIGATTCSEAFTGQLISHETSAVSSP